MYHEAIIEQKFRVSLACDHKRCHETISVCGENRDESQLKLYLAGWRLKRGKQVCPKHASSTPKTVQAYAEPNEINSDRSSGTDPA